MVFPKQEIPAIARIEVLNFDTISTRTEIAIYGYTDKNFVISDPGRFKAEK